MTSTDDATLAQQILEGSDRAFNLIVDRHERAVRGFLRRLLANAADADDIAQETFVAAWEGIGQYSGGSSLRSWLCAIAWRKAKSAQRSWFRSRTREARHHAEQASRGETAVSAEDRLAVKQALLTLPIRQRAAVALCLAEGFSHGEAAQILGLPLGTVKSHVTRGKALLFQALGGAAWQDEIDGGQA